MSIQFHAVLLDETGCEFGADVHCDDRESAYVWLRELYPESRVVQLESPQDTAEREARIYARIAREIDGDDDYYDEEEYIEFCHYCDGELDDEGYCDECDF